MKSAWLGIGALVIAAACGGDGGGPATGSIQGVVTDTAANPQQGVTVLLKDATNTTIIRGVAANASGGYSFVGVATGSYNITITLPPATQVKGADPVPVAVTAGGTALADFSLRLLPVSFTTHVQSVFSGNCVGCHTAGYLGGPPQGLILTADSSYILLVDSASMEQPLMKRIRPGKPDSSYLIHKVQNTQMSVGGSGQRMPLGVAALPLPTIQMLRRWVSAGAPNN